MLRGHTKKEVSNKVGKGPAAAAAAARRDTLLKVQGSAIDL